MTSTMAADRSAPSDPALNQVTGFLSQLGPCTEFRAAPGDHPAGVSIAPERVAAAAARSGVPVTVEADPVKAVAVADAEPGLPVVVSGSFHLLAAIARVASDPFR